MTTLILAALAVARLTRLVTADRITEAPRAWVLRRVPEESLAAYFVFCDWCVSVYTGAAVAALWALWGDTLWFQAPAAALAFSYAAGFLNGRSGD